jgi:dTDP-4-dehydrorhamnose reductase
MDITDVHAVERTLDRRGPRIVIHAAALRGSRECEADPEKCLAVNVGGTYHVVRACGARGIRVVYVSTDYVFDGNRGQYAEDDPVAPVNHYARSKLAGELITRMLDDGLVIRTAFYRAGTWKFRTAFVDQFSSQQSVDVVAGEILLAAASPLTGVVHIGGLRRSTYEIARESDPAVQPARMADAGIRLPGDVSLDSRRWRAFVATAPGHGLDSACPPPGRRVGASTTEEATTRRGVRRKPAVRRRRP